LLLLLLLALLGTNHLRRRRVHHGTGRGMSRPQPLAHARLAAGRFWRLPLQVQHIRETLQKAQEITQMVSEAESIADERFCEAIKAQHNMESAKVDTAQAECRKFGIRKKIANFLDRCCQIASRAAVASPRAHGHGLMGEGSVAAGVVPGSGDPPLYMAVPRVEAQTTTEVDGYWQRRGKSSARRRVRQFFLGGSCSWKGHLIKTQAQLAASFDGQVIREVDQQLRASSPPTKKAEGFSDGGRQLGAPPRLCLPMMAAGGSAHGGRTAAQGHHAPVA